MANSSTKSISNIRKKITTTYEMISTAHHEAGHAIYGLLRYMTVSSVCIFENKKSKRIDGFTHYTFLDLDDIKDENLLNYVLDAEICVQYAGLAAEKQHFKNNSGSDKFPMFLKEEFSEDTSIAADLIKKYNLAPPGRKRYLLKRKMITKTLHELKDHWDAVTIVAHALFQRKRLSFSDLKELLTKKTKNKQFWKEQFKNINIVDSHQNSDDEKVLKLILLNS